MSRLGFAVCAAAFVGFTLAVWRFRGAGDAAWYAAAAAVEDPGRAARHQRVVVLSRGGMSRLGIKAAQAKRRAAVDAALIAGYRTRDIQRAYKVSATMVRLRRVALGLPPAQRGRRLGDFDAATRSPVTDEIIDRVVRLGRSDREAARELGLNQATVQYARERWVLGLTRASRRK